MKLLFIDKYGRNVPITSAAELEDKFRDGAIGQKSKIYDFETKEFKYGNSFAEYDKVMDERNKVHNKKTDSYEKSQIEEVIRKASKFKSKSKKPVKANKIAILLMIAMLIVGMSIFFSVLEKEFDESNWEASSAEKFAEPEIADNAEGEGTAVVSKPIVQFFKDSEKMFFDDHKKIMALWTSDTVSGFAYHSNYSNIAALENYKRVCERNRSFVAKYRSERQKRNVNSSIKLTDLTVPLDLEGGENITIELLKVFNKGSDRMMKYLELDIKAWQYYEKLFDILLKNRDKYYIKDGELIIDDNNLLEQFNQTIETLRGIFKEQQELYSDFEASGIYDWKIINRYVIADETDNIQ